MFRPLFRGRTFSLKSSHSCPVSCLEAKNSVSGSGISTLVSAIVVVSFVLSSSLDF